MIHLNFISSPDENIIGDYQTHYHDLVISAKPGADLFLDDVEIKKSVVLQTTESGLKITFEDYFLVEGKKHSGSKILQVGETLQVGQTKIRLLGQMPKSAAQKRNIIEALDERVRAQPEISDLIIELEKELIRIEQDKLVAKKEHSK